MKVEASNLSTVAGAVYPKGSSVLPLSCSPGTYLSKAPSVSFVAVCKPELEKIQAEIASSSDLGSTSEQ